MTGDACDDEYTGETEDDDGESIEEGDAERVSGDEIKNISDTSIDSPLLKLRLLPGMLSFQF